jgi:aminopeptidase YwaD
MTTRWKFTAALFGAAAMELIAAAACAKDARDAGDVIAESTVRAHMEFLAGDAMNGRGSGTRDEWIAATYIAAQLRRCGLQPLEPGGDYVQAVEIARIEAVGTPTLRIEPGAAIRAEQMLVMRLNGAEFRGPLQMYRSDAAIRPGAALLMPRDALPEDAARLQPAGLVLWRETAARRARWNELSSRTINIGRARIGGVAASTESTQTPPSQIMLAEDAYAAVAQLEEGSMATVSAVTRETLGHTWNAVGVLPGSGKQDGMILLSAHLDHLGARDTGAERIYNGADDDASGSTAVLALAEALAQGTRVKRSVVFAWFGSEEAGGFGARYFVDKPVLPLDKIVANLEFEMIGRPDASVAPHTLWLTGWERTTLGPELAAHGARLVADPHPAEKFFMRSDNIALARRGVVAQTVSSFGLHADYHQPSDKISRIDFAHMTQAIQSMLAPVRWLADSGFKPDWVKGGRPAAVE